MPEHCLDHRVAHQHLRSRAILLARNSKYLAHSGNGKLSTSYPAGESALERILRDLSAELPGAHGAGILSDLRYREVPLYVRYGGFAERWTEHDGTRVPAIRRPDGTLVPDPREPAFSVPDWVRIPDCLAESVAVRTSSAQSPYRVAGWEHHYLAMQQMPGTSLGNWLALHYPLTRRDSTEADLLACRERALAVMAQVQRIIGEIHRRGIVFGELHALNVLVDGDDTVSLVDFEMAIEAGSGDRLTLGAPGFPAPADRPGFEIDEQPPDWSLVRKQIAEAVLTSATPERRDRLFPGDIEQFRAAGAGFAVGAAGVLHSLHVTGAGRYPEHEQWLLGSVRREPPARPGFFDGSHGIAYVLEEFGYHDEADRLLTEAQALVAQTTDHGLGSGLAGIGLTRLHFATSRGDNEFGRQALDTAVQLAEALDTAAPPGRFARAGLLSGWTGPALLFLRLYERTGEAAWLVFADQALDRDLEECVQADDGSLQVRDGARRTLRYLGVGSAGILVVAEQLARHRPEAKVCRSLPGLREACRGEFVLHPGLLHGRCGLAAALSFGPAPDRRVREAVDLHLARLSWRATPFRGGRAPLLRLSTDVSTGSTGILRTLSALLDGTELLPFLGTTGTGTARPAT
ncbi:hypothetical protein GCM10022222_82760 [Amycolatopsis ultiminotia]|uniref:RamC N-terminal domain-containing protein n=1 Tax=Amycolatopsis ultiminotia TaxID=543629 RepID=A0ABP6YL77_9PSEU